MNDKLPDELGPVVAELAGHPLDDADLRILQQMAAMYDEVDPVPDDLVGRIRFALALDEVFDEVARMTRVPLDAMGVRGEQPAGTRTETLTFSAERLTAMVTSTPVGVDAIRLDGWLAPAEPTTVRLRMQHAPVREVRADASGRFSFDALPEGFAQLSFHLSGAGDENAVVTPLFQL